jgi:uncharacterized protein (TIGR00304 family)
MSFLTMEVARYVPLVLLAVGAALIVDAVLRGSAHAALILIVPVLTGGSVEFLFGVLLLFLGLLSLPALTLMQGLHATEPGEAPEGGARPSGSGGVVLIGPVPIFFGEWGEMRRRTYWWWVAVASVLFAALLVVWVCLALGG